jgi:2-succinyl-6-hydroxy-2,4-cyclohexadiene-1-carboxylate synthase
MAELLLGDVRLAYLIQGAGPPVTLLHGFTQNLAVWEELIALMPPRWRWIRVDLRGHGTTRTAAGAPHTLAACHADLEALWQHLGIPATHLAGYSLGGRLALHVAASSPGRLLSLCTIGAHAGLDDAERRQRQAADEGLAARIESEGIDAFVEHWGGLPIFAGQSRRGADFVAAVRAQRLENDPRGLAEVLRQMGSGAMEPLWSKLASISCPALFVAGAEDLTYAEHAQRLAVAGPRGRAILIPGAGHAAHLEQPEAVAAQLQAHLSSR